MADLTSGGPSEDLVAGIISCANYSSLSESGIGFFHIARVRQWIDSIMTQQVWHIHTKFLHPTFLRSNEVDVSHIERFPLPCCNSQSLFFAPRLKKYNSIMRIFNFLTSKYCLLCGQHHVSPGSNG